MTGRDGERIEQTSDDLVQDYEGLMVPCPFCDEDADIAGQPKPYLSLGKCHYCSREFEIIIRWEDEQR